MSKARKRVRLSGVFDDLATLKQAVRTARSAALAEAKETVRGRGFFRSSGAEFVAADACGNKLSEGGVHFWEGTRRSFEADIKKMLEMHPQTIEISLEGTYSWAEKLSDFDTGDHDPGLSDWAVVVWRAGGTDGGDAEQEGARQA